MKRFIAAVFIFSFLFAADANAQNKKNKNSSKSAKSKIADKDKIQGKIFSAGVVNGKAIHLEKPFYPVAARNAGIYGRVSVFVLISEDGNVIEAKLLSGQPLLVGNTISAALKSKFQPVKIGGNPVKVSGLIVYNFVPDEYNWLDIGNSLKSYELDKKLPFGFEEERKLFETYKTADDVDKRLILQTIRASIENKISTDEKKLWLFQVGALINEIGADNYLKKDLSENIEKLKTMLLNPPPKVSSRLVEKLDSVIKFSSENPAETGRQISYIWENISLLGR